MIKQENEYHQGVIQKVTRVTAAINSQSSKSQHSPKTYQSIQISASRDYQYHQQFIPDLSLNTHKLRLIVSNIHKKLLMNATNLSRITDYAWTASSQVMGQGIIYPNIRTCHICKKKHYSLFNINQPNTTSIILQPLQVKKWTMITLMTKLWHWPRIKSSPSYSTFIHILSYSYISRWHSTHFLGTYWRWIRSKFYHHKMCRSSGFQTLCLSQIRPVACAPVNIMSGIVTLSLPGVN